MRIGSCEFLDNTGEIGADTRIFQSKEKVCLHPEYIERFETIHPNMDNFGIYLSKFSPNGAFHNIKIYVGDNRFDNFVVRKDYIGKFIKDRPTTGGKRRKTRKIRRRKTSRRR